MTSPSSSKTYRICIWPKSGEWCHADEVETFGLSRSGLYSTHRIHLIVFEGDDENKLLQDYVDAERERH